MASGRFQGTRGRWEVTPVTTAEKVVLSNGTSLVQVLESLNAEFATNQEILDIWRLSEGTSRPVSP